MPLKLSRPRILNRAAKAGAALYERDRDLAKIAPGLAARARKGSKLVRALADAEAVCEGERKRGAATYSLERHVSLLSALLAEAGAVRTV
ncbi:MAG: DUF6477 family protein [Pseudomonadota bacterium]